MDQHRKNLDKRLDRIRYLILRVCRVTADQQGAIQKGGHFFLIVPTSLVEQISKKINYLNPFFSPEHLYSFRLTVRSRFEQIKVFVTDHKERAIHC